MLSEVSSEELSEWMAYFEMREQKRDDHSKAEAAKKRAKKNNR
jgi:hypothetical protein